MMLMVKKLKYQLESFKLFNGLSHGADVIKI